MGKAKAKGERGSWYATVNGERLACIHRHWLNKMHYCEPGFVQADPAWMAWISAIKDSGKAILTNDHVTQAPEKLSGVSFERTSYVAVYAVDNVQISGHNLEFDLVSRLCELQGSRS